MNTQPSNIIYEDAMLIVRYNSETGTTRQLKDVPPNFPISQRVREIYAAQGLDAAIATLAAERGVSQKAAFLSFMFAAG